MGIHPVHLVLTLDTQEPIELEEFVATFTSLGEEFQRYIRTERPDLVGEARVYVKEIRKGSIEADMLPFLSLAAPFIADMDKILIVEEFVRLWGSRLKALIDGRRSEEPKSKSEYESFADAVTAVANDPNGSLKLAAAVYEDDERRIRSAFVFNTQQAKAIRHRVSARLKELSATERADHERVLMTFVRADFRGSKVGKPSGEVVRIERVSPKVLPLVYASSLAEERIKSEAREADSIFYKGFVVDVNVEARGDKPIAYAVTNVHQVIDLPRDDSSETPRLTGPGEP